MFLNEKTVLRSGLFEGIKLASHKQGNTLTLCRFGQARTISMVAIDQNLDKLLVFDLTSLSKRLLSDKRGSSQEQPFSEQNQKQSVSYISIKDQVIETLAVVQGASDQRAKLESVGTIKDLLLIGCSSCIMIYDTLDQEHLFSVQTSSKITMIAPDAMDLATTNFDLSSRYSRLLFCGGVQKLYAYHLDCTTRTLNNSNTLAPQDATGDDLINFECSNERTISETVSCLIWGRFGLFECLVAGFHEKKFKVFTIDSFDQSIQICRLTLTETAKINCLCAIETVVQNGNGQTGGYGAQTFDSSLMSDLPAIMSEDLPGLEARDRPQMNYFAYGLENGTIGVYRLLAVTSREVKDQSLASDSSEQHKKEQVSIFGERLWRHRSKQAVVALSLFDIDGDGQDELIVGYRNGRLEVRSPFTGQLITKSRCFKTSGQQLVGFLKWSLSEGVAIETSQLTAPLDAEAENKVGLRTGSQRDILLACSSTSSLVAFKPKQRRPHQVLIDHLSNGQRLSHLSNRGDFSSSNFVSSLGQQQDGLDQPPAQDRHLVLADQDSDHEAENNYDDDDNDDQTTDQGNNKLSLSCESKQNPELLHQIGLMKRRHEELGRRFNQIQRELLRRQLASNQSALELISGGIKSNQITTTRLTHCWNFDATNNKLLLTLVLEPLIQDFQVAIEMIEIQDSNQRLLPTGHLIIHPVKVSDDTQRKSVLSAEHAASDSKSSQETNESMSHPKSVSVNLVLGSWAIAQYRRRNCADSHSDLSVAKLAHNHEPIELKLSIYLANGVDSDQLVRPQKRLWRHESASFVVQNVLKRTITMPKFAMFVPESLIETGDVCARPSRPMIRKTFVLPESANKLGVLDWLNSHMLYFQFNQIVDHENHLTEFHNNDEDIWAPSTRKHQLEFMRMDANIVLGMRKLSGSSSSAASVTKELENTNEDGDVGFEYEFLDLETLETDSNKSTAAVANARRLRLKFSPKDRRLTLVSDDSDLLVELIKMLIIEQLQLSVNEHSINDMTSSESDGVDLLLKDLQAINENSRQLEESERRIQTEIYESSELVKSLMQQLNIANDIKEYGISRELVAEISMILNGTQNSAQAFNLNNRTRLDLMKQANCLREKILFLTGNENEGERVS